MQEKKKKGRGVSLGGQSIFNVFFFLIQETNYFQAQSIKIMFNTKPENISMVIENILPK